MISKIFLFLITILCMSRWLFTRLAATFEYGKHHILLGVISVVCIYTCLYKCLYVITIVVIAGKLDNDITYNVYKCIFCVYYVNAISGVSCLQHFALCSLICFSTELDYGMTACYLWLSVLIRVVVMYLFLRKTNGCISLCRDVYSLLI